MVPEDKKSKYLYTALVALTLLSISATYYNYMVLRNFEIVNDLDEITEEES